MNKARIWIKQNGFIIIVMLLLFLGFHWLHHCTCSFNEYKADSSNTVTGRMQTVFVKKQLPDIYKDVPETGKPTYLYINTPDFEIVEDNGTRDGITDYSLTFFVHITRTSDDPDPHYLMLLHTSELGKLLASVYSRYNRVFMSKIVDNVEPYERMLKEHRVIQSLNEIAYELEPKVGRNCFDDIIIYDIARRI